MNLFTFSFHQRPLSLTDDIGNKMSTATISCTELVTPPPTATLRIDQWHLILSPCISSSPPAKESHLSLNCGIQFHGHHSRLPQVIKWVISLPGTFQDHLGLGWNSSTLTRYNGQKTTAFSLMILEAGAQCTFLYQNLTKYQLIN